MTYDTVLTNSHVILPDKILNKNILINDGKIVGFATYTPQCDIKINCEGLISIPGMIDTHVHYGVYSPLEHAATTESRLAAIGGVTTIMRMLRLSGSYQNELSKQLLVSSNSHHIDYTIHASILNKSQINEMKYCIEKGISSFKLYMNLGPDIDTIHMDMNIGTTNLQKVKVNMTDDIFENVIKKASRLNCPVLVHAENYDMCLHEMKNAQIHNQNGLKAWSKSRPQKSEVKSIKLISALARKFNCILYFVHIGSISAMKQIIKEKNLGTKIYTETCPHYLSMSHDVYDNYLLKVMPPIRTHNDISYIWKSLSHNYIDAIGTDHVANKLDMKIGTNIWNSLAGFPGLGTTLPLLIHEGIHKKRISLHQLIKLTSVNAAKIFGMYPLKGSLNYGSDADITIIDLNKEIKVHHDLFNGFSA